MIADIDLRSALGEFRESWSDVVAAWNAAASLAKHWDANRSDDVVLPPELLEMAKTMGQWQNKYSEFYNAAQKYLSRRTPT
jgi:hypothetical protein